MKAVRVSLTIIIIAVVCIIGIAWWRGNRWTESRENNRRVWKQDNITQIDENGDGLVDEEIVTDPATGKTTVRRDNDHDGYFDLQYELGQMGVATNIRKIHEKAPRH